jgi:hypothetical protein
METHNLTQTMKIEPNELDKLFPFEYQGGGYFRRKGTTKEQNAEILHGQEAIKYLYDIMKNQNKTS